MARAVQYHVGILCENRNNQPFQGATSLIDHSPPEGRQAVPCILLAPVCSMIVDRNARQISSERSTGPLTGEKTPFVPDSGLSQLTAAPLPCGSRASAIAPAARRQSSVPSSGDNGDIPFAGFRDAVVRVKLFSCGSDFSALKIGRVIEHPPVVIPASSKRASIPPRLALGVVPTPASYPENAVVNTDATCRTHYIPDCPQLEARTVNVR